MQNNDKVCGCNNVTVEDVLEYLKNPLNTKKSIEEKLEDLNIGTACRKCKEKDCDDRIDIHYSEIIK